jgi:hypothetical protein
MRKKKTNESLYLASYLIGIAVYATGFFEAIKVTSQLPMSWSKLIPEIFIILTSGLVGTLLIYFKEKNLSTENLDHQLQPHSANSRLILNSDNTDKAEMKKIADELGRHTRIKP